MSNNFIVLFLLYVCISILGISMLISLIKFKVIDTAGKIISVLLISAFLTEILSLFSHKIQFYNFYTVIEIFLTSFYFLKIIKLHLANKYIVIIGFFCLLLGAYITYYDYYINTNILILESFLIISMSIFALYRILIDENIKKVSAYPHFWIWTVFLLYWSGSYFYWAFLEPISNAKHKYGFIVTCWHLSINIILYVGIGIAFFICPKKIAE
jgi:hypothetical protein